MNHQPKPPPSPPAPPAYTCFCGYDLRSIPVGANCPECGAVVATNMISQATSGLAVGAFASGILAISCFGAPVFSPIAITLGVIALREARAGHYAGSSRGLAIAGIITGALGLLLFVGSLTLSRVI